MSSSATHVQRRFNALALVLMGVFFGATVRSQEMRLKGVTQMVFGDAVWTADKSYKASKNWLALACDANGCTLEAARLTPVRAKWQGHYDDQPTWGVELRFSRPNKSARKPIAWLRKTSRLPWLKPGPVPTYASVVGGVRAAAGIGTMEIELKSPTGSVSRLVPLLRKDKGQFLLQLRSDNKRQMLIELGACEHEIDMSYLQWSGDMDGDGKTDYLIDSASSVGEPVLYVSSLANADELVGVAAVGIVTPFGGECDGGGWLEANE